MQGTHQAASGPTNKLQVAECADVCTASLPLPQAQTTQLLTSRCTAAHAEQQISLCVVSTSGLRQRRGTAFGGDTR